MPADESAAGYFIWGADFQVYGPVELPTLVSWVKDERVLADTWLFLERSGCWEKAEHVPELQMFFHANCSPGAKAAAGGEADVEEIEGLSPAALRHVKVLAGLNNEQLTKLVHAAQIKNVPQGTQMLKQGDQGDAMYVVVEGEIRLRAHVEGRETTLAVIHEGEFFGEISLFDHGPRSADAIATLETTLLKITAGEFEKMVYEMPDLAAPILFAMIKTLTARVRSDNRRYRDSFACVRPPGVH